MDRSVLRVLAAVAALILICVMVRADYTHARELCQQEAAEAFASQAAFYPTAFDACMKGQDWR